MSYNITAYAARQGRAERHFGWPRRSNFALPGHATYPGLLLGAALSMLVAAPVLAEGVVDLGGVFGNVEGCHAYETGQPLSGTLLLTGDTFSSAGIGCAFQSLVSVGGAAFTVSAVCSPGGAQTVQVVDHGPAGYGFVTGSGFELGPLFACVPARITGSLPLVQL